MKPSSLVMPQSQQGGEAVDSNCYCHAERQSSIQHLRVVLQEEDMSLDHPFGIPESSMRARTYFIAMEPKDNN